MITVTTYIPAARASALAQFFEAEGLDVSWAGPVEKRAGAGQETVKIVYYLATTGGAGVIGGAAYDGVKRAIQKIRERFPQAELRVEQKPDED